MKKVVAYFVLIVAALATGGFLYYRWPQIVEGREFRATIPADHYEIALRLLNPRTYRLYHPVPKELAAKWERQNDLPMRDDVRDVIRHLDAIPSSAPQYKPANELLPYLRALLDRPREYDAMVGARLEICAAAMRAPFEVENKAAGRCVNGMPDPKTGECRVMFCGNAVWEGCKPLNDLPMSLTPAMLDLPKPGQPAARPTGEPLPEYPLPPAKYHVVIATRDLPVGHVIKSDDVREVPSARVLDGSFVRSRQVAGRAVVLAISNGANIRPSDVSR